jgi:hypothetical protein
MDGWTVALLFLTAAIVGLSKSGLLVSLGAINVPLLTLVMPARDAAGILLPVMLAVDAVAIALFARAIDRRTLAVMLPGCVAGNALGWQLSAVVSEEALRLAIGLVTLAFVLDAWLPLRRRLERTRPSAGWGLFWGAATGFTSFVSHTGGPPYQIFVLPQRLPPVVFAGTTAVFFAINNAIKILPYAALGQLGAANLALAAAMVPVALAALAAGVWVVRRLPPPAFYAVAHGLLFLFALKLIWDGLGPVLGPSG